MIHYSETNLVESHEYFFSVIQQHAKDVHPGIFPEEIEVDIPQILEGEKAGSVFSIKAQIEKETVGVICGYVGNHMQHKNHIFACTSLLQAKKTLPTQTRIEIVKGLISKFEEIAKEKYKASFIQLGISSGKDIRNLIEPLGYKTTEYVLTKRV